MFRLLDRYLVREIVPYVLLGLMLLTAIIFAQEASRFSELLVVASRNGLPMETLGRVMSALVPGILVFTLPISLLIGTLVGLGRLSGLLPGRTDDRALPNAPRPCRTMDN